MITKGQYGRSDPYRTTWRRALAVPAFSRVLVAVVVVGIGVALAIPHFFDWIQGRSSSFLRDPVLELWKARDVSTITFTVLYGTVLIVIVSVARSPLRVLHGLAAYVLMVLFRMLAMSFLTLEPPPGIIPLVDPFTQVFYPGSTPFLKDLFFSGHTATLTLMIFLARKGPFRWFAALCTAAVGMLVLVQHVHWSVDVVAAVPAAWLAWTAAGGILRKAGVLTSVGGA